MFTTPEHDRDLAAEMVASALVREASASTGHRRLVLGCHLGVKPKQVLGALAEKFAPNALVTITEGRAPVTLQGVPLPGDQPGKRRLLLPYLVGDVGPNAGSAGFAALLRDHVTSGPGTHVLLILDPQPVETVRTAAEDAATLDGLSWQQLSAGAAAGASAEVQPLLRAVLRDDERFQRLPRTAATLARLRHIALLSDASDAGAQLHSLGCYLSDTQADYAAARLRESAKWRTTLENWLAPGQDFEKKLTARYTEADTARLNRVLAALTPFGLNYEQFTFDDMPGSKTAARAVRLASPLSLSESAVVTLGNRAMVWKPGGGQINVALSSAAGSDTLASLTWSDSGESLEIAVAAGDRHVEIVVDGAGWRFARIQMPSGQAAELAVYLDTGSWAPFEPALDFDLTASAFRSAANPQVLALGPAGELAGQPAVERPDPEPESGDPEVCLTRWNGEEHPITLLIDDEPLPGPLDPEPEDPAEEPGEEGEEPGESGEEPGEVGDESGEEGDGSGDDGGSWSPTVPQLAESVPHARLLARRNGNELGDARFLVTVGGDHARAGVIATPARFDLASQGLGGGRDGLDIEQQILNLPHVTAFSVVTTAGVLTIDRYSSLDSLDVSGIEEFETFMGARTMFFTAVRPHGSVHAIGAGHAVDEARAYVAAYEKLLEALLESARFAAEYERLFLMDAVVDGASGEILIAPTSPLSVAYLMTLSEEFESWHGRASDVQLQDIRACTMRHLVPYFAMHGTWYETGGHVPLLWRKYKPAAIGVASENRPAYIKQRVEHFTRVHPEYLDERQELGLAFHEPGNAAVVLEALRLLARPHALGSAPTPLPKLAVTIVSSTETRTVLEDLVAGQIDSTERNVITDRLLQDRLEVVRAAPDEGKPIFAHLSFVFDSSLQREPATVELNARAGTLFAGGLAAVPGRYTEPGRNEKTFMWGTFTGSHVSGMLSCLVQRCLEVVGGMPRDPLARGRTRMPSTRIDRDYLHTLYRGSAWVVHLDRLLGLEAFAPDARGRGARYLIDYEDRHDLAQPGLDAITATDRVEPYRRALRQAIQELGQPTEAGLDLMLRLFNGVSGQWALDLVGANPNDLHERIGLAVAVASIQDLDGGLHGESATGLVLSIDEMLKSLPQGVQPSKGFLCDDLLYVRIPEHESGTVVLRGRLLEVKYRGSTDPGAATTAHQQLKRARDWLQSTFGDTASPGRMFRARDLAELIRAAATRASAFGLMSQTQRAGLESALEAVSRGEFSLRLDFQAGTKTLYGDFVSIEASSAVPAHRQALNSEGKFGHVRLGRPALRALAAGDAIPRPLDLAHLTFSEPGGEDDGTASGPDSGPSPSGPDVGPTPEPKPDHDGSKPDNASAQDDLTTEAYDGSLPPEASIYATRLDEAFTKYGLSVEPFRVELALAGPSLIRFRTRTLGKLSISDIERRSRDLGRETAAPGEIVIGDEPGYVTVDVPRSDRQTVPLRSILGRLDESTARPGALSFVAGVAPSGAVEIADLSRLPHLLVAGATGSGKSVFLRGLLLELLRQRTPGQLSILIIDPKRLDFAAFARAPHVRGNAIISDPDEALERLQFTLDTEIARRGPILEEAGVSSASEYYESGGRLEDLPQLVILVDEFSDLVLAGSDRRAFSEMVQRYAQLTRAYGVFLVLATQRPSVDVITGSIKANLSARIAFSLPSATDSRTVLDRGGAEDLLGDGDLLFYRNGRTIRLQAPLTTITDVRGAVGT
ncbi:FtsK/SpoIIIE domain-containing protein [Amycolatopsis orientalis]|uniref:FtsK/SpoIIIE domain-containing protein n=1 Tax=Amycolatopsis orientalis TaxID=31958 RepID=UPI001378E6F3|nr:FtsK/SpoIIIE domain-containing protein [Amycolatopsis orientalis]